MNPLTRNLIEKLLRHGLNALGAVLVAQGYVDQDALDSMIPEVIGAVILLGSVVWSLVESYRNRRKLVTAMAVGRPVNERQVESIIKDPMVQTPPVTKSKDSTPYLKTIRPAVPNT